MMKTVNLSNKSGSVVVVPAGRTDECKADVNSTSVHKLTEARDQKVAWTKPNGSTVI